MAPQAIAVSPIDSYVDNRAIRYFDIFPEIKGQVTISVIAPNSVSGWHKHKLQADYFFVAKGRLTLKAITPGGVVTEADLTSESPVTCVILPEYWHGWRAYDEEVVLCYFLTRKHDENDEYRATAEEIFDQFGVLL